MADPTIVHDRDTRRGGAGGGVSVLLSLGVWLQVSRLVLLIAYECFLAVVSDRL